MANAGPEDRLWGKGYISLLATQFFGAANDKLRLILALSYGGLTAGRAAALQIDLPGQQVTGPDGYTHAFDIAPADKEMLVEGLDPIGLTLRRDDEILAFQERDKSERPWVYI